ncbi:signal-induced proliferation-associated 1-like protein 1 [Rhopalosiphum padi]|uniref:signal-induced proliferation-associated 1-like protein 1 n=1 Tax=Rhopalosiphum padi TaxID=40932 RepID=UPI00298DED46|nr:signal-induced proliferation-associated 1-like protein 1 [Rhopalosiphum padi]
MIGLEGGARNGGTTSTSTARQHAAQAMDYYNSNVLRARTNAGLSSTRGQQQRSIQDPLYRSNSSLELTHHSDYHHHHHHHHHQQQQQQQHHQQRGVAAGHHFGGSTAYVDSRAAATDRPLVSPLLKREYGSHGSIDVISSDRNSAGRASAGENFFALLQDYRPTVLDMIDGNSNNREFGYREMPVDTPPDDRIPSVVAMSNGGTGACAADKTTTSPQGPNSSSPKLRLKFHKFWGANNKFSRTTDDATTGGLPGAPISNVQTAAVGCAEFTGDERQKRRGFAHYDVQSLTATVGLASKLQNMLSRRRNTATGASAASMLAARSSTPDSGDEDLGDGKHNNLLDSCPFFRNELGGEVEREVSLTQRTQAGQISTLNNGKLYHRPRMAYGISVLEFQSGETHWTDSICPENYSKLIETSDEGDLYYRSFFFGQEHQNWFGLDETLGPVAISLKRERVETDLTSNGCSSNPLVMFRYRIIIRTSELQTLRGSILEDAIPNIKLSSSSKHINTKDVLEYIVPEIPLPCLRLGVSSNRVEELLLGLDEQGISHTYKVGVMYCRAGQFTEEHMYNNEEAGLAFYQFMDSIAQRVRLKGFNKYRAGLDNKTDSTGLYSFYSQFQNCEIMFHVSTMLPFTPNNRQQLLRKRHIGNDIVTIVFQEPGAQPFSPKNIRSQFQHVFIVVRVINPCTENTQYSVAVTRSKEVEMFGPPIPKEAVFKKSKEFSDFLLAKIINAENAAHRSEKFATMATRTRQAYLKDLTLNHSSNTTIEPVQKFSMLSFSSKKKERWRPRFQPDASQRGAICWQVVLEEGNGVIGGHCLLAISSDSMVLVEENNHDILLVIPCKSILGWTTQTNSLRIYYHEGECVTLHMHEGCSDGDRDELMEVVVRLRAVTQGSVAQELSLHRNSLGQLGFHVQPDGLVTQVEKSGLAWEAGLRQNSRLIEICKVAVATLTHDQMVDLLKTSVLVTVTVIPPFPDGSPRRGCHIQNCSYRTDNSSSPKGYESEYENVAGMSAVTSPRKQTALQQPVSGNHRKMYERSLSPPRSSNSSGYGTMGSNKSYTTPMDSRFPQNPEGTLTSSSSGHSSDDRWYDLLEVPLEDPPPVPTRLTPTSTKTHSKVHASNSLPLSTMNNSFSVYSDPRSSKSVAAQQYDFVNKSSDLNNDLHKQFDERLEQPRRSTKRLVKATSGPELENTNGLIDTNHFKKNLSNGNIPETLNERILVASEDDVSTIGSSSTGSPHSHRKSLKNNGSRNQSPRSGLDRGEPRLRPGISGRNSNASSRLSGNMSTLQEDLMKLIDPDYNLDSSFIDTKTTINKNPSRENVSNVEQGQVILTKARPATVISSAPSPALSEMKPLNQVESVADLPLPDTPIDRMNWKILVDTATEALRKVSAGAQIKEPEATTISENKDQNWSSMNGSVTILNSSSTNKTNMSPDDLEMMLRSEMEMRMELQNEVKHLREENRRLQDESNSAAQQLKHFTHWFFQNIDKHPD